MAIGDVIRKYRKQAGMTQEEMARRLGVTAPAVNKWENNNTQPDIALLAPVARLLGINTDTLLSFQDSLSPEEIAEYIRTLDQDLEKNDYADVFAGVKKKIEEYPNCGLLVWQCALIMNARLLAEDVPAGEMFEEIIFSWFERCLHSEDEKIRKAAADSLFQAYLRKEDHDKAYSYLSYFSSDDPERKRKEALIFSKTGRKEEAYRIYEELLFTNCRFIRLVLNDLRMLYLEDDDLDMAWKLAGVDGQAAKVFEMGGYDEIFAGLEVAAKEKNTDKTERIMRQILASADEIGAFANSDLYRHMMFKKPEPGFAGRLRDKLIEGMEDETFEYMKGNAFWDELTGKNA